MKEVKIQMDELMLTHWIKSLLNPRSDSFNYRSMRQSLVITKPEIDYEKVYRELEEWIATLLEYPCYFRKGDN